MGPWAPGPSGGGCCSPAGGRVRLTAGGRGQTSPQPPLGLSSLLCERRSLTVPQGHVRPQQEPRAPRPPSSASACGRPGGGSFGPARGKHSLDATPPTHKRGQPAPHTSGLSYMPAFTAEHETRTGPEATQPLPGDETERAVRWRQQWGGTRALGGGGRGEHHPPADAEVTSPPPRARVQSQTAVFVSL